MLFLTDLGDAGHAAALVRTLIEEAPTIFEKAAQLKDVVSTTNTIFLILRTLKT